MRSLLLAALTPVAATTLHAQNNQTMSFVVKPGTPCRIFVKRVFQEKGKTFVEVVNTDSKTLGWNLTLEFTPTKDSPDRRTNTARSWSNVIYEHQPSGSTVIQQTRDTITSTQDPRQPVMVRVIHCGS